MADTMRSGSSNALKLSFDGRQVHLDSIPSGDQLLVHSSFFLTIANEMRKRCLSTLSIRGFELVPVERKCGLTLTVKSAGVGTKLDYLIPLDIAFDEALIFRDGSIHIQKANGETKMLYPTDKKSMAFPAVRI
ncbi:MAG: hypothetical protein Q8O95_05200 [bacterium]|nr:hypothetical protein [bacterium]